MSRYIKIYKLRESVSHFSHVQLFTTPRTVACQATLSTGFSKQEYWSGLPYPLPGDLPNPGIKLLSIMSPVLSGEFFTTNFPDGSDFKKPACNTGDVGSIPGLGRSPGEENGNAFQYSGLENSMDRGAWWTTVHGVSELDMT